MTSNSRFVPAFALHINDQPIPAALRAAITGISCETGFNGSDRVEVTLANGSLQWQDNHLLRLDNSVKLSLGYEPGKLEQVFVGEIVGLQPTYPSNGMPTLTIAAQDRLHHLQRGTKSRWFAVPIPGVGNFPLHDTPGVIELVTLENGLLPAPDLVGLTLAAAFGGIESAVQFWSNNCNLQQLIIRKQAGESDFTFLERICKQLGYDMLIDHSDPAGGFKLRFTSSLDRLETDLTLEYGRSLLDFTPRVSNVGQIIGVTCRLWVPAVKMEFTVSASWDWDRQALDISIYPGSGIPAVLKQDPEQLARAVQLAKTPAEKKQAEANQKAAEKKMEQNRAQLMLVDEPVTLASAARVLLSELVPKLNQRLTGSGSTIGDTRIKPGAVLRIKGVGRRFGGRYRVTSATHTIDEGGFQTQFELRKDIWLGSIPRAQESRSLISFQGQAIEMH